ncbi:hypothetical protein HELRODRAFT_65967, partial [Helobdella robusta]|uniref:Aminotransferase class I/classII large domain-containing protein n=1 Tax=Helobdella robusta TaxID=6412 RepID=T1FYF4_HELRO
ELCEWLINFQMITHKIPNMKSSDTSVCITSGSMEGLCKTFEMLVNAEDDILVETPTYPGVLSALRPLGCNIISLATDHNGIIPESLEKVLSNYEKTPKFIYTIPNGTNPTGASTTLERKKIVYQLAREYDLLILEDDPYYFLQFNKERTPSYLSMDEDGRVIRFDSFSKILSSGIRLGFVTGPAFFLDRIVLHHMVSTLHASPLSQILALELLKKWDIDGLEKHVSKVVEFYRKQKDVMIECAKTRLKGLAEWHEPVAGMFLWMRLLGMNDTKKIEQKAKEKKVLFVPGCAFYPDDTLQSSFVRASFSMSTPSEIDEGFKRLAELIKEEKNE